MICLLGFIPFNSFDWPSSIDGDPTCRLPFDTINPKVLTDHIQLMKVLPLIQLIDKYLDACRALVSLPLLLLPPAPVPCSPNLSNLQYQLEALKEIYIERSNPYSIVATTSPSSLIKSGPVNSMGESTESPPVSPLLPKRHYYHNYITRNKSSPLY